jgi:dCTP deaminase
MILSDTEIKKYMERDDDPLVISPPPDDVQFQPASVDLRLGDKYCWYPLRSNVVGGRIISIMDKPKGITDKISNDIIIGPGEFLLMETEECVHIPLDLVGRIEGRSSIGRMGIMVHVTAGFFDSGFKGVPTLEVKNVNDSCSVKLFVGQRICQMSFELVMGKVLRPYGTHYLASKYQGANGVEMHKVERD